jgi:prepilin-type N-terminal cleavage/methylation domain-containing protein/prepilin-type processing-associated H-X9-DG protein
MSSRIAWRERVARPTSRPLPRRGATQGFALSGFTLIELLVVIAIIAILAAILFPVFGRARENARRSSCQSNLKQMGLGIMQYTQDYDEKMPPLWTGSTFPGSWRWMDGIQPYVKNDQIFNCPSDTDQDNKYVVNLGTVAGTAPPDKFGSYAGSNAYWGNLNDAWGGAMTSNAGITISIVSLESPSTTFMVGDSNGSFQLSWQWNNGATGQPDLADISGNPAAVGGKSATDTNMEGKMVARHLDTLNILFCDGHVKAMKLTSLLEKSTTAPTWGTWASATNRAGLRYFTRAND